MLLPEAQVEKSMRRHVHIESLIFDSQVKKQVEILQGLGAKIGKITAYRFSVFKYMC